MHTTHLIVIERGESIAIARVPAAVLSNLEGVAAKLADCGVRIRATDDASAFTEVAQDSQNVIFSLGEGACLAAAAMYASATGRECRSIASWQAVIDAGRDGVLRSAFVFLPQSEFTVDAIGVFVESACDAGVPVGFFPIVEDHDEALNAALRLVALAIHKPARPSHVLFFSEHAPGDLPFEVYRDASQDEFYERASAGADAIVFTGHGNGACFKFGASALCVLADHLRPEVHATSRRMLPCQVGGPCLQRGVRDKRGASVLNADVLVLLTCWGWVPYDGYIDQHFSLAQALLRLGSSRAIVTSYTVSVSSWQHGVAAQGYLCEGGTAGQLTHVLNELLPPGTRPYICIGDPEAAIAVPADASMDNESDEDEDQDEAGNRECQPEDPATTASSADNSLFFLLQRMVDELGEGVPELSESLVQLRSDPDAPLSMERVATLLARRIASHGGAFWKHYSGGDGLIFGENQPLPGTHACGARWWASDSMHNAALSGARRLCTCSRCGVVADLDSAMLLQPVLTYAADGGIELELPQKMPGPLLMACGIESSGEVEGAAGPVLLLPKVAGRIRLPELKTAVEHGVQGYVVVLLWPGGFASIRLTVMRLSQPQGE